MLYTISVFTFVILSRPLACLLLSLIPNKVYYVDENDNWTVHYVISDAQKGFPDNYNETVQLIKNGELVGETIWQKDRYGNIKKRLQKIGIPFVPERAKRIMNSTP